MVLFVIVVNDFWMLIGIIGIWCCIVRYVVLCWNCCVYLLGECVFLGNIMMF